MAVASITSSRDFRRAYRSGRKARVDGITVWVAGRGDEGPPRLGMAIRATAGSAVARNRLRRRIREIFRTLEPGPGTDVVVAATPEAVGSDFQQLETHLTRALTRLGVGRPA